MTFNTYLATGLKLATSLTLGLTLFSSSAPAPVVDNVSFGTPQNVSWVGPQNSFADYNHDGHTDILTRIAYQGFLYVSTSNANGTFTMDQIGQAESAYFADVNGDGWADIVYSSRTYGVIVRLNDQNGWFGGAQIIANTDFAPTQAIWDMAIADVDHDGDLDIVTSSYRLNQRFNVLLNDGNGNFSQGWQSPAIDGEETVAMTLTDLDGDGAPDLVATGGNRGSNVWRNDGHGNFSAGLAFSGSATSWCAGITHYATQVVDINGDGRKDILTKEAIWTVACQATEIHVAWYENTGDLNHFTRHEIMSSPDNGSLLAAGDINGDGAVDFMVSLGTGFYDRQPTAFLNDGHGTFTQSAWVSPTETTNGGTLPLVADYAFLVDLDGDGKLDLLTSGYYGGAAAMNTGAGGAPQPEPTTTTVSFGAGPFVYNGSAFTATASTSPAGTPTITYSGDCVNAGSSCTATATYAGDATHLASSASATITIAKASSSTTVSFGAGPFPYKGTAYTATASVSPSGTATITYSGDCVNAGTSCTATATYAGSANVNGSSATAKITITYTVCSVSGDDDEDDDRGGSRTKGHESGSTIPVKIRVCNAAGRSIGAKSLAVKAVSVSPTGTLASNSNPGNLFRLDDGSYQYNLSTKGYAAGNYTLDYMIGNDPTVYHYAFTIRASKSGKGDK
jgi:hypothetical protein